MAKTASPSLQPVAVITGAASGIGAALATSARARGYALALADLADISGAQTRDLSVRLDVRDAASVRDFANQVFDRFGRADLVFNNAGIMRPGRLWDQDDTHLNAVMDINLGGVINGVRAFVPRMIASGMPGRIVNTASLAGLIAAPGLAAYCISKHAVVALSETLAIDLQAAGLPIRVSVVCPSAVSTSIMEYAAGALNADSDHAALAVTRAMAEGIRRVGAPPVQAAEAIFTAIERDKFWIRPLDEPTAPVIRRAQSIEAGGAPAFEGWDG